MKRKFTLLLAAFALLTMITSTKTMRGQTWEATELSNLTSSDVFVIVSHNTATNKYFAMSNDKGTTSAPSAVSVTVSSGQLSGDIANNIKWQVGGNATEGYVFYPNGQTQTWLYCTNANNGVRVGTNMSKTFKIDESSKYLVHKGTNRYMGVYNNTDWRCYTTIHANIQNQTFAFYKYNESTTNPTITASDVNIAYDATTGSIAYTINNAVSGGTLTASTESDWLIPSTVSETSVPFTCSQNEAAAARTATVTLTYTYTERGTVTKNVAVTQAGNPNVVNNISDINTTGTYAVQGTIVAMNSRGFVVGDGTGYAYYYYGNGFSTAYTENSIVKISGQVTTYNNVYQFQNTSTLEGASSSNYNNTPAIQVLDAAAIGNYSTGNHLSDYVQIEGKLVNSGTYYNIQVEGLSTDASISFPTSEQTTTMTGLIDKQVIVKGYFAGVSSNHFNVILGSIEEKTTTDPSITVDPATVNAPSEATNGTLTVTHANITTFAPTVYFCNAEGASTTYDWISASINTEGKVEYNVTANNNNEARTAYLKVTAKDNDNNDVYSNLVTINQAKFTVDYATLPFYFNGGKADIENTDGLTQIYLGADYNNYATTKLKFEKKSDTEHSTLTLKLNAAPVSISYDIIGNNFSGSTFKVQVSANGSDYTDLKVYTELRQKTQTVTLVNNNTDVRYIRWIYYKTTGNVGLGNIHVTDNYDTYGEVTFDALALTASSKLIVHKGSVVTVNGTLTNTDPANLVIEDGGQLIFNSDNVQATVKKSTAHAGAKEAAADWYTIASPLAANVMATEVTNLVGTSGYDFYRYNEKDVLWENYKNTAHSSDFTGFENGRGYLYWNANGEELAFIGVLRNADVSYSLKAESSGNLKGFNLIGNPFSQNITMRNITGAELPGGYVLTQAGNWKSSVESEIAPCQGFLVQVSENKEITIGKNAAKSRSNRDYIAFTASNNQYEDVTYALFEESAGLNKISHRNNNIPMIYISQNGQDYAIASMSDDTEMFGLNFKAMTMGYYTLSYEAKGKYNYLHVLDRRTGKDIDMLLDGEYRFIASPSDSEARFIVKLKYNADDTSVESDIIAHQDGNDIVVNGEGELQIFDVMGRMIATQQINGVQTINVSSTGIYIFKLNEKTQKIVVR